MEEKTEEIFLDALEQIEPSMDDFINRRINHMNFARIVFWLCVKSRTESFFYARELSKFIRLSLGRVHHILTELVENKILRKRFPTDNLTEFWFVKNKEVPVIHDYFNKAQKTLKLKVSMKTEDQE